MTKKNLNQSFVFFVVGVILLLFSVLLVMHLNKETTDADVFDNNINKVVEIRVSDDEENWGFGTGFFISDGGHILTNKHMVVNSSSDDYFAFVEARLPTENDWVSAKIIAISPTYDLAKIKIEKSNTAFFEISESVKNGEEIFTIGNPNGFGLSFAKGNVSCALRNVISNSQTITAMQTSLVINEGNSGGPVFNKQGKLLGIISFRLKDSSNTVIQGVSFAILAKHINEFLAK